MISIWSPALWALVVALDNGVVDVAVEEDVVELADDDSEDDSETDSVFGDFLVSSEDFDDADVGVVDVAVVVVVVNVLDPDFPPDFNPVTSVSGSNFF